MLTKLDKAIVAFLSSGAMVGLMQLIGGPFIDPKLDTAAVMVATGILTWLVPNK